MIDCQTFQNMLLGDMQAGVLPNMWRFVSFEQVIELSHFLEAKPITDNPNSAISLKLFRRRSTTQQDVDDIARTFVDWRKAFVILSLMSGKIPTEDEKQSYYSKLRAKRAVSDDGLLSESAFVKVS